MAFRPFGKDVGPSVNPRPVVTHFGSSPRPPYSPSQSDTDSQRVPSPPLPFQNTVPSARPYQSAGVERVPDTAKRLPSPPVAFQSFRPSVRPYQSAGLQWTPDMKRFPSPTSGSENLDVGARPHQPGGIQRPPASTPPAASQNSGTNVTVNNTVPQDFKRTRSPPSYSRAEGILGNHRPSNSGGYSDFHVGQSSPVSVKSLSPQSASQGGYSVEDDRHSPFEQNQSYSRFLAHQVESNSYGPADMQDATRTNSLTSVSSQGITAVPQRTTKRMSVSPAAMGAKRNVPFTSDSKVSQSSFSSPKNLIDVTPGSTSFGTPKRARSPLISSDVVFQGNPDHSLDDTDREEQAKAKRLARFKNELSYKLPPADTADSKISANKHQQPFMDRQKFTLESLGDEPQGKLISELESSTSTAIIGLCHDMCPVSEREERQRKGDLDQYERLDGDRNMTSKELAVKKYNRTAERETSLIRPMPILRKTMDYLLNLLDQPYDDTFLGIYNFLWDRMRAIRMDLRMQHIFDRGAISMLEQMIRLHIIAMHELCEYTKGEGFSEGFDAHLNIEQMNKTSVELFQMYDDHRKKGIMVPSEMEFRGYYALLKLDKHPGYKVEPAELSLDLAKMTPEIRQAPEVLFARDVARACRTGNFISFFRLARKASYLQACLMHAHFAKLRTQALASLHSGLQNNQGLPVSDVAKWICVEEEDIKSLLDYHGFSLKEFEEPYLMKDGPFLNADKDYPTKCSRLVHLKRSRTIAEDVSPSCEVVRLPTVANKEISVSTTSKMKSESVPAVQKQSSFQKVDEEMPKSKNLSSTKESTPVVPLVINSTATGQSQDHHMPKLPAPSIIAPTWNFSAPCGSPRHPQAKIQSTETIDDERSSILDERDQFMGAETTTKSLPETPLRPSSPKTLPMEIIPVASQAESFLADGLEDSLPQSVDMESFEGEPHYVDQESENDHEVLARERSEEAALAKLKLMIRLWRRWSSRHRKLREQRQLAASIALDTLSLGPPIRVSIDQQSTSDEFDIDHLMRERVEKRERSWSRLNVSEVTLDILSQRNQHARCLCWKVVVCSQVSSLDKVDPEKGVSHAEASKWLLSKLMPSSNEDDADNDLVITSPSLAIWKKWVIGQSVSESTCCLSVVKDAELGNQGDAVWGAQSVLFLASESIPLNLQKIKLHQLLMSVPSGAHLPLLILSGSSKAANYDPSSDIADALGLYEIDQSKVCRFLVLPMVEDGGMESKNGFFSDDQLREGLRWLASNSPTQPVLCCLNTRELLLTHLNSSLERIEKMPDYEVGPNYCIAAFNKALDQLLEIITSSAEANSVNWPCPEIGLLCDSSPEYLIVKWYLPSIGWSSAERIEPLKTALRGCKLPTFHDDLTWLTRGCSLGSEIENQRLRLETTLIEYLTEASAVMGSTLAAQEASVIVQRCARLEVHGYSYYIVPKWVMIFRRIFNWQLMRLSIPASSSAYVLESHLVTSVSDKLGREANTCTARNLSGPSLDEVIEVGPSLMKPPQELPIAILDREVQVAGNNDIMMEDVRDFSQRINESLDDHFVNGIGESNTNKIKSPVKAAAASRGAHLLGELLEKCNIVQNNIAESLSIYF